MNAFGEYVIEFSGGPLDGQVAVGLFPGLVVKLEDGNCYKNSGKVHIHPDIGKIHRYDHFEERWDA